MKTRFPQLRSHDKHANETLSKRSEVKPLSVWSFYQLYLKTKENILDELNRSGPINKLAVVAKKLARVVAG